MKAVRRTLLQNASQTFENVQIEPFRRSFLGVFVIAGQDLKYYNYRNQHVAIQDDDTNIGKQMVAPKYIKVILPWNAFTAAR